MTTIKRVQSASEVECLLQRLKGHDHLDRLSLYARSYCRLAAHGVNDLEVDQLYTLEVTTPSPQYGFEQRKMI